MNLQTQIPLKPQQHNQLDYQSEVVLIGSCFSENIGNKLTYYKFKTLQNPFGILFHPKAIETIVNNAINQKEYTEQDIFFQNERWHTFDAHSSLSSPNKNKLLNCLNEAINTTSKQLKTASHIVITLGTSWVYRFIESDSIVANCHKIPQKKFLKEILSVEEISESLDAINSLIKSVNKNASILYTVSPVRHIKDGFIENQRSKSHLLTAIHSIIEPRDKTYYFPSYEIMMDELRDYRFYTEDMIHPNTTAINYIWEKFNQTWFTNDSLQTMIQIEVIQKGLAHRSFNPNSEAHQKFISNLQEKIKILKDTHTHISF